MAEILGNGLVVFGDGTSLSSANVAWSALSGVKTNLSQFVNDLPLPANSISNSGVVTTAPGFCSGWDGNYFYLTYTNNTIQLVQTNCNCNCNC